MNKHAEKTTSSVILCLMVYPISMYRYFIFMDTDEVLKISMFSKNWCNHRLFRAFVALYGKFIDCKFNNFFLWTVYWVDHFWSEKHEVGIGVIQCSLRWPLLLLLFIFNLIYNLKTVTFVLALVKAFWKRVVSVYSQRNLLKLYVLHQIPNFCDQMPWLKYYFRRHFNRVFWWWFIYWNMPYIVFFYASRTDWMLRSIATYEEDSRKINGNLEYLARNMRNLERYCILPFMCWMKQSQKIHPRPVNISVTKSSFYNN